MYIKNCRHISFFVAFLLFPHLSANNSSFIQTVITHHMAKKINPVAAYECFHQFVSNTFSVQYCTSVLFSVQWSKSFLASLAKAHRHCLQSCLHHLWYRPLFTSYDGTDHTFSVLILFPKILSPVFPTTKILNLTCVKFHTFWRFRPHWEILHVVVHPRHS